MLDLKGKTIDGIDVFKVVMDYIKETTARKDFAPIWLLFPDNTLIEVWFNGNHWDWRVIDRMFVRPVRR